MYACRSDFILGRNMQLTVYINVTLRSNLPIDGIVGTAVDETVGTAVVRIVGTTVDGIIGTVVIGIVGTTIVVKSLHRRHGTVNDERACMHVLYNISLGKFRLRVTQCFENETVR